MYKSSISCTFVSKVGRSDDERLHLSSSSIEVIQFLNCLCHLTINVRLHYGFIPVSLIIFTVSVGVFPNSTHNNDNCFCSDVPGWRHFFSTQSADPITLSSVRTNFIYVFCSNLTEMMPRHYQDGIRLVQKFEVKWNDRWHVSKYMIIKINGVSRVP